MHVLSLSLHAAHDRAPSCFLRQSTYLRPGRFCRRPWLRVAAVSRPQPPHTRRPAEERDPQAGDGTRSKATAKKLEIWKSQLAKLATNPRAVAVSQLLRVEEEGAFVGLVGGSPGSDSDSPDESPNESAHQQTASSSGGEQQSGGEQNWRERLSDRDARFVTELVSGVTRWRRRLDYVICQLTGSADVSELDPPMTQVLRLGLYELVELQAPPHVINEHVQLVKRVMNTGAGGFANGVLRNAIRQMDAGKLPRPRVPGPNATLRAQADALAISASHPTWLVERWLRQLGPQQAQQLLKRNNQRPAHSLRLSPGSSPEALCAEVAPAGVVAAPSRFLPSEFVRVESGLQSLLATGLLAQGKAQVQDEAAGLVVAMLGPQPGEDILDACAAPGGKTLFAAARMGGQGRILALDVSAPRLQALSNTAQRQGYGSMVATHAADFRQLAEGPVGGSGSGSGDSGSSSGGSAEAAPQQAAAAQRAQQAADLLGPSKVAAARARMQQQQQQQTAPGGGAAPPSASSATLDSSSSSSSVGSSSVEGRSVGSGTTEAEAAPASAEALLRCQFDRVLLDAPCSGTGVLAKRADLRWRRQPGDLRQLASLQDALLDAASAWVKPGGLLVYSTCSIEPEENEVRVRRFLAAHPEYSVEAPPAPAGVPAECLTAEGFLQMLPHVHGTDGAFAARLRRGGA